MDGFEAAKIIKSMLNKKGERLRSRVVAISAHASEKEIAQCFECGMDKYSKIKF